LLATKTLREMIWFLVLLFIVLAAFSSAQYEPLDRASGLPYAKLYHRTIALGYRDRNNYLWIFMMCVTRHLQLRGRVCSAHRFPAGSATLRTSLIHLI
jgi:hypothetical protein